MPDCKLLSPLLARVAALYPSTKFCSIVSDHCIENYPDKNCPTLLCYRKGEMTGQIVGMGGMGGNKATIEGAFFLGFVVPTFLRSFPPFAPSPSLLPPRPLPLPPRASLTPCRRRTDPLRLPHPRLSPQSRLIYQRPIFLAHTNTGQQRRGGQRGRDVCRRRAREESRAEERD